MVVAYWRGCARVDLAHVLHLHRAHVPAARGERLELSLRRVGRAPVVVVKEEEVIALAEMEGEVAFESHVHATGGCVRSHRHVAQPHRPLSSLSGRRHLRSRPHRRPAGSLRAVVEDEKLERSGEWQALLKCPRHRPAQQRRALRPPPRRRHHDDTD